MRSVRRTLFGLAVFQVLTTLVGAVQLIVVPRWHEPMLAPTILAGQYLLAASCQGVITGGAQWAAVAVLLGPLRPHAELAR